MESNASSGDRKPSVTALVRGLHILQCFDRPGLELTVSTIARRVGLSQPTCWRLCTTLIECGFLVKAPASSALRIGAPALTLGYAAIHGQDLPGIARPYMAQASGELGGTITLGLCTGLELVSVEQTNGTFILPNQPVGWRAALTSVASGLCVLAILPEEERAQKAAALAARDPAAWPRRLARLEAAQRQFHDFGYVASSDMFDGQYSVAAVPLIEGTGTQRRYWALSCGGVRSHWPDEVLANGANTLKRIRNILQPAASVLDASRTIA